MSSQSPARQTSLHNYLKRKPESLLPTTPSPLKLDVRQPYEAESYSGTGSVSHEYFSHENRSYDDDEDKDIIIDLVTPVKRLANKRQRTLDSYQSPKLAHVKLEFHEPGNAKTIDHLLETVDVKEEDSAAVDLEVAGLQNLKERLEARPEREIHDEIAGVSVFGNLKIASHNWGADGGSIHRLNDSRRGFNVSDLSTSFCENIGPCFNTLLRSLLVKNFDACLLRGYLATDDYVFDLTEFLSILIALGAELSYLLPPEILRRNSAELNILTNSSLMELKEIAICNISAKQRVTSLNILLEHMCNEAQFKCASAENETLGVSEWLIVLLRLLLSSKKQLDGDSCSDNRITLRNFICRLWNFYCSAIDPSQSIPIPAQLCNSILWVCDDSLANLWSLRQIHFSSNESVDVGNSLIMSLVQIGIARKRLSRSIPFSSQLNSNCTDIFSVMSAFQAGGDCRFVGLMIDQATFLLQDFIQFPRLGFMPGNDVFWICKCILLGFDVIESTAEFQQMDWTTLLELVVSMKRRYPDSYSAEGCSAIITVLEQICVKLFSADRSKLLHDASTDSDSADCDEGSLCLSQKLNDSCSLHSQDAAVALVDSSLDEGFDGFTYSSSQS